MSEVVYDVDLLFQTLEEDQPGSMQVRVMAPIRKSRLSVVVEVTSATPVKGNIKAIVSSMQADVLNRLKIDAVQEADVFLDVRKQPKEFPGCKSVKLTFDGDKYGFEKVDEIVS
ncbi:MAG: hypothetical protein FWH55_12695 [Oscillospiraceae bacterium]|nr:hypothetical protein [Oscillospiraceae bacterium]